MLFARSVHYWWTRRFPQHDTAVAVAQSTQAWSGGHWQDRRTKVVTKGKFSKHSSGLRWQQEICFFFQRLKVEKEFLPRGHTYSTLCANLKSVFVFGSGCSVRWLKASSRQCRTISQLNAEHWCHMGNKKQTPVWESCVPSTHPNPPYADNVVLFTTSFYLLLTSSLATIQLNCYKTVRAYDLRSCFVFCYRLVCSTNSDFPSLGFLIPLLDVLKKISVFSSFQFDSVRKDFASLLVRLIVPMVLGATTLKQPALLEMSTWMARVNFCSVMTDVEAASALRWQV